MEPQKLEIHTVVQLNPGKVSNPMFAACFMVVTESKSWGAQGYVTVPGENGLAYYRAEWHEMELIGTAVWVDSRF